MITLNVLDALAKIDPSLEEAAESVGFRIDPALRAVAEAFRKRPACQVRCRGHLEERTADADH